MARAKLIELWARVVNIKDKRLNIYHNGESDDYPAEIRRVIENSVTATTAVKLMTSFIYGRGFNKNPIVNSSKRLTLNDVLEITAKSVAEQKGAFIHVNYNVEGDVNYMDVLDYTRCRISRPDDKGNPGMVHFYGEGGDRKKVLYSYYPFNDNVEIINQQRRVDATDKRGNVNEKNLLTAYRGQVYFLNLEPTKIYPLAFVDPVYNDADSEYRVSEFKNTSTRNGFIGKVVATVLKTENSEEAKDMDESLKAMLGAANTGNLLKLESELGPDGKLIEVVKFDKIEANISDSLFQHTEATIRENILTAFNNIPISLVVPQQSLIFSQSLAALQAIQLFYQAQLTFERSKILRSFIELTGIKDLEIIKLVNELPSPTDLST